ncbi:MAG: hypothetical protein ABIB61_04000 [Candidatus Shapirobacteria bacterium]
MDTESVIQTPAPQSAREASENKGRERRERFSKRLSETRVGQTINKFKNSVSTGIDVLFRSPEIMSNAYDKLTSKLEKPKNNAIAKVTNLTRRAAVWGLTSIAEPIENRIRSIYEIPAGIQDWKADRVAGRAEMLEQEAYKKQERITQLRNLLAMMEKEATGSYSEALSAASTAQAESEKLRDQADGRRYDAKNKFSKARNAVAAINATA